MSRRAALAAGALAALLPLPAAAAKDPLAGFDAFVAKQLEIWKAPGASVAVVRGDEVVLLKGYGYRDLDSKAPMTHRTVQPIASITKSFTVASLAVLVRDGKLSWDKPVREYLLKQGRFAHFTEEDLAYFQAKVDEMWDKWEIPGVVPFRRIDATKATLASK